MLRREFPEPMAVSSEVRTVRTKESYEVALAGDTTDLTTDIRTALDEVSRDRFNLYAFPARDGIPMHGAAPEQRDAALHRLARRHWRDTQ